MENEKEIPYGKCRCGCGGDAPIAKMTDKRLGHIKGEPIRYINGHCTRGKNIHPPQEQKPCACGCGGLAPLASITSTAKGQIRGQSKKFIPHHHLRMIKREPLLERFWRQANIKGPNECWEWKSTKGTKRYGTFKYKNKTWTVSRLAFFISGGKLTEGKNCVLHSCDNRKCVNPAHLFAGSNKDNVLDRVRKNRSYRPMGEKAPKAKLTEAQVIKIREVYKNGGMSIAQIANIYSVHYGTIHSIIKRGTWRHL